MPCARTRTEAHNNGKAIHGYLLGNGIDPDLIVQNATVDMFAKSEHADHALKVFERMKKRDGISWTVILPGFSLHGKGELGVEFSLRMEKDQRVELIDQFTCVAVLHCCPTACTAEEGKIYFKLMPSLLASCSCLPF